MLLKEPTLLLWAASLVSSAPVMSSFKVGSKKISVTATGPENVDVQIVPKPASPKGAATINPPPPSSPQLPPPPAAASSNVTHEQPPKIVVPVTIETTKEGTKPRPKAVSKPKSTVVSIPKPASELKPKKETVKPASKPKPVQKVKAPKEAAKPQSKAKGEAQSAHSKHQSSLSSSSSSPSFSSSSSTTSGQKHTTSTEHWAPADCPANEPSIALHNLSPHPICYMITAGAGVTSLPDSLLTVRCGPALGPNDGFMLKPGSSRSVCPDPDFHGAITSIHHYGNGQVESGSRFEFTFKPDASWYDIDYELGLDSSYLAPIHPHKDAPAVGEPDMLAKINAVLHHLPTPTQARIQAQKAGPYLVLGKGGKATKVGMNKSAPAEWKNFLQLEAKVRGYVNAGSIAEPEWMAESVEKFGKDGVSLADRQTKRSGGREFVAVNY